MAVAIIGPKFYAWGKDGLPLAFGKVFTFAARTNSPKDTFQSEDGIVENDNPVILNGEGYANIYLDGSYKVVVKDSDDNEIWSADPVTAQGGEEWVNCFSATYLSPTQFKIVGNVTDRYTVDRRVRIDNGTTVFAYSTILSSVFSGGETTVSVFDSVVLVGIITVCASIIGEESIKQNIESTVFSVNTLQDAVESKKIKEGDAISFKERTTGNGGGGVGNVVLATSVTPNTLDIVQATGIATLAIVIEVGAIPDVRKIGAGDGIVSDTDAFDRAAVLAGTGAVLVPNSSSGYDVDDTVDTGTATFILNGSGQLVGSATEDDLGSITIGASSIGGFPLAEELRDKNIEVISGTLRQQQHQPVVSITRSATTATVTQIAHGYLNGDKVNPLGAVEVEYNIFAVISNVTTDTYDYTVSGSPATPATGTITARKPAQWDWIKDGAHEPVGVVDSAPVIASANTLTIPFIKTYSKVLTMLSGPDDTLARKMAASIGGSVGTSSMVMQWSLNRTLAAAIKWDGADWNILFGANQGGAGASQVNITDATFAGGVLTLTHDYLPGFNVSATARDSTGVGTPYLPVINSVGNTTAQIKFIDTLTGLFVTAAEDTEMSFFFTKNYNADYNFDGGNGDADALNLEDGNIWFYGIMQV